MFHSILTFLGRYTCKSDLIKLGIDLMYHSILSYVPRQTYLYNWFDHTLQETKCIIPFWLLLLGNNCTSDLTTFNKNIWYHSIRETYLYKWSITLGRNLMNHFIVANAVSKKICISDFNTLYRNFMYHCILTKKLLGRHTCTGELYTFGRNLM